MKEDLKVIHVFDTELLRDHSTIAVWREGQDMYRAQKEGGLPPDAFSDVIGTLIPRTDIFPAAKDGITEFQLPALVPVHIKNPHKQIIFLEEKTETSPIPAKFLEEIELVEMISKTPHPNICKYYGCIRGEDDLIEGMCFQKYSYTLKDVVSGAIRSQESSPPIDVDTIVSGIKEGLNHLHSLGIAHNDINPSNIMLDDTGHPIIIDFDVSTEIGASFSGGTPGWTRSGDTVASIDRDMYALDLIAKFVRGEYDGYHGPDHRFEDLATENKESKGSEFVDVQAGT